MEKKATITDVAREVGVSKTTISRYLNGGFEYMSDKTRQRIEAVIKELNYVPNSVARTLKSKRSMLIGVVVNTLRYQVAAQTVTGINDVCTKNGYGTVVCCSDDDPDKELQGIQLCLNQQVDGLIIIPCLESPQRYLELCQQGIPVVLCTRRIQDWPYGCVYVRHDELISSMLVHLKQQGFERVRFLQDVDNFHKNAMGTAFIKGTQYLFSMSPEESVVLIGREGALVPDALDQFLDEYPGQKKAVLAVNTHTLFLVLKELERRKIRIPQDLGVCGYDAVGWSELVHPGITSIRQPMDRMGIVAGEKMIRCLQEGGMSQGHAALEGTLAFRQSTQAF